MDPATLAVVSLAGSALSAGVGAIGAMSTASSQAASANYQAAVQRNNQIIQSQNAQLAAQTGRAAAQQQDFANRQQQGKILAAEGASGIDIASPTYQQVRTSTEQTGRLSTQTTMQKALEQVYGYNVGAEQAGAQAQLETMQAQSAQTAGTIGAFSSLIGGATSFADKWQRFTSPSPTGGLT
jgi:hypothetical protein